MDAIGQWLTTRLGISASVTGLLVLPALALLLIFSLRQVVLRVVSRFEPVAKRRHSWGRFSRYVSILAGLVVVGLVWRAHWPAIAADFSALGPQSGEMVAGVLVVALYGAILAVILYGVQQAYRAAWDRVQQWGEEPDGSHTKKTVLLSAESLRNAAELGLRFLRFAIVLFLLYLFVPLLLDGIPATRPLAHQVMPLVFDPLKGLASSIVGYTPRLIILILIFVIARWTIRGFRIFMQAVGAGEITLGEFDPDWADQTFSLVRVLMVLATILIMYPYLPGASSDVFRGFSVFVGALVTFGASSTTNNIFNGLILTYTRAFREGDLVKIGGQVGDVLELGMVATRLRTLDNEKVTIANTQVLNGEIVNYSEATAMDGLKLRVAVEIGYDTEWRQVYELLLKAAGTTENVRTDPAPHVQQSSLDDFAVTYTLVVSAEDPKRSRGTLSALRENIQDTFNEAGIEMMTPSMEASRRALDPAIPERYRSDAGPD